jgi:hypothetical protein
MYDFKVIKVTKNQVVDTVGERRESRCASNRSTNAKAAQLQPTTKALASVLLSDS